MKMKVSGWKAIRNGLHIGADELERGEFLNNIIVESKLNHLVDGYEDECFLGVEVSKQIGCEYFEVDEVELVNEVKFLSRYDKEVIAKFIRHQLEKDDLANSWSMKDRYSYGLCDEFIDAPKDDVRKSHFGMQFILEMMLHQLPYYPSEKEYLIEKKRLDKENARSFNEC
jgi:hypothetical protein